MKHKRDEFDDDRRRAQDRRILGRACANDDGPTCRGCRESGAHVEERFSLGITAGNFCDPCWNRSGYRKEGREGFDPAYAGESYEEE